MKTINSTHIIYENVIHFEFGKRNKVISRHHVTAVTFACALPLEVTLSLTSQIIDRNINSRTFTFDIFKDYNFEQKYNGKAFNSRELIFGKITTDQAENNDQIGIKKCWATQR